MLKKSQSSTVGMKVGGMWAYRLNKNALNSLVGRERMKPPQSPMPSNLVYAQDTFPRLPPSNLEPFKGKPDSLEELRVGFPN